MDALREAWYARAALYADAREFSKQGDALRAGHCLDGNLLSAGQEKLRAESNTLYETATRLRTEGNLIWAQAVLARHGNVRVGWRSSDTCTVEGETYS